MTLFIPLMLIVIFVNSIADSMNKRENQKEGEGE